MCSIASGNLQKMHLRRRSTVLIVSGLVVLSAAASGLASAAASPGGSPSSVASVEACLNRGRLFWMGRPHLVSDPPGIVGGFILGGAPWSAREAHVSAAELFVLRTPMLARRAAPILRSEYVLGKIPASILRKLPPNERPLVEALGHIGVAPNAAARAGLERIYHNVVVIWPYPLRNATFSNQFMALCLAS